MIRNKTFNLLKPLEAPKTAWDKVYDWILGKARIIVLLTIILITIAFIAKVIVDTDAKNKTKTITKISQELAFYATELEPKFRLVLKKEDNYLKLWNSSSKYSNIVTEIYSYISNPGAELIIRIEGSRVSISGTEDLLALKQLEVAMKDSASFSSVFLDTLTVESENITEDKGEYALIATIKENKREQI